MWVIGGDAVAAATHRLTGALQNGPDAVRLLLDAAVVDRIGYGALSDADQYESEPAADVTSESLARIPDGWDTQNNALDLQARRPSPGRRNVPRREWQLYSREPEWHRFWPGRHLRVQAVLRNVGEQPTTPADWQLHAELAPLPEGAETPPRSLQLPRTLRWERVPAALAAGDSALLDVAWVGESGPFVLRLQASGQDEWVADNHVDIVGRVGSGPVIINEIQYAPLDELPEWVEVWNRSPQQYDLNGWTLGDASGRRATLQATGLLAADSFAVLREGLDGSVPGATAGAMLVTARPWPSLNNTDNDNGFADILELRDASGLIQDAVFYSGANTVRGRSLERVHADADVRGVLWSLSKHPQGATPGSINSVAGGFAGLGSVTLQPNPISPDGDGVGDVLHVRLLVPEGQEGFRARLFDLQGRQRRDLAGDRLGPGARNLLWDGTDDSGDTVELGVYLIHFEFFGKLTPGARLVRTVGVVRP
jgi:hypothetical protein